MLQGPALLPQNLLEQVISWELGEAEVKPLTPYSHF